MHISSNCSNISFVDLANKSVTPSFKMYAGNDDSECILRFHGGEPYQDVAFKIVNKEWEHSDRFGFRCSFDRGVFRLHFQFKKYKYRR